MSYCVNCGVELDKSANKCPLCDTPVINPNMPNDGTNLPPFPTKIELPKKVRAKYAAFIASCLILLPNIICVITNLLLTPQTLWSVYVVSSCALLWFISVFPFLMSKKYTYLILVVDTIVTNLYIFIFYYYNSDRTGWFLHLAVPLTCAFFIIIGILCNFFKKKRTIIQSILAIVSAVLSMNIIVCILFNVYMQSVLVTYITIIFSVSCVVLLIFFIAANNNYRFRAWLSRKFFF